MGFLNLLEGPHSFAPELQRQRGGGGEEALFLPTSSPPKPAEPLGLGGGCQWWGTSQNAGSWGREQDALSATVPRAVRAL